MRRHNKLDIINQLELAKQEERIKKLKALELFDTNKINKFKISTINKLSKIHEFLFNDIYYFAVEIRKENITKGKFRFASTLYLKEILVKINKTPKNTFDEIIKKCTKLNIAHPFRESNARSTHIWLNII